MTALQRGSGVQMHRMIAVLAFVLALPLSATATARPNEQHAARPSRPRISVVDNSQRIDVNNISMFVTNTGSFAWDKVDPGQPAGLEFPKGTGKTAVFAAGLWLGAKVGGGVRVAISEYSDEYGPGSALGGVPEN